MKGRFLAGTNEVPAEKNIYSDKSALVLNWLLYVGINKGDFSLRQVMNEVGVSIGLVQKVFAALVSDGILKTKGIRTSKRFTFSRPNLLLQRWLERYSIVKKCKMRTYRSGLQGKKQLLEVMEKSDIGKKVVFALHSAAEELGCKNNNLDTLELYVLDPSVQKRLEQVLLLEPQERGYEVLLIEPYYKALLLQESNSRSKIQASSALLTYLDLYHFPLRGREQADFLAERIPKLKCMWG